MYCTPIKTQWWVTGWRGFLKIKKSGIGDWQIEALGPQTADGVAGPLLAILE